MEVGGSEVAAGSKSEGGCKAEGFWSRISLEGSSSRRA